MEKLAKQYEVLQWASLFLEKNNSEQKIAEILLQHHLNVSRTEFYMMMQDPIEQSIVDQFKRDIHKHVETRVPIQHLTGYEYFYGRKFIVNEDTLIPRPETEELVQHVINSVDEQASDIRIVDVGTGSGIIAITLALELPNATIYATDISAQALRVAEENAIQLNASVEFMQGNYLQPIIDEQISVDYLVSNPPYIAKNERAIMSRTVKDFDPEIALFAEENGLASYKEIIDMTTKIKSKVKRLAFEIGYQQASSVSSLIKDKYPQGDIEVIQDINNNDRIVTVKLF